jgi:hypothetical protein
MVYIVKERGTEYYKIGFTSKSVPRVSGNQTGNPRKLILITMLDGDDRLEAYLHRKFNHLRIDEGGTEWFKLNDQIISELKEDYHGEHTEHSSPTIRNSAFDVRSLCRGQQYIAKSKRETIPRSKKAFDNPVNKHTVIVGGRKHKECLQVVLW